MFYQGGDPFVYWFLHIVLLFCLFYSGYLISSMENKDDNHLDSDEIQATQFWKYALLGIISFSLIEGLRWNRGADYPHYYQDLTGELFADYKEPLYLLWVSFFKLTGFPGCLGFVIYSLALVFSFYCLVRCFPKVAVWALPLFPLIVYESENLIRQFFATSFFLFALAEYYYCDNRSILGVLSNKRLLFFMICVPCIHLSGLFVIVVFLVCVLIRENNYLTHFLKYIPYLLSFIYIWFYFFWDGSNFNLLSDFLSTINFDENTFGGGYIENSDRWFSEEGSISQVLGKSVETAGLVIRIPDFFCKLFVIFFGCYAAIDNHKYKVIYLFSFFAIIIKTMGDDIEMYNRFYQWLVFSQPIMIGIILSEYEFKRRIYKNLVMLCFFFHYILWGFIRNIGSVGYSGCAFIWDS